LTTSGLLKSERLSKTEMSILVTAIRSGNLEVVKEKFSRPVSFLLNYFKVLKTVRSDKVMS